MTPCIWFVSESTNPWERSLIGSMASAVRARGGELSVFVDGGTVTTTGVSWRALSFMERSTRVLSALSGQALWHLWGAAPAWWSIVQLRSRTVHTSLDDFTTTAAVISGTGWRGHPSRVFHSQARQGETVLVPTFEMRAVPWGLAGDNTVSATAESETAIYVGMKSASPTLKEALGLAVPDQQSSVTGNAALALLQSCDAQGLDLPPVPVIDTDKIYLGPTPARSGILVVGNTPSEAVRAAVMTMRGLVVVGYRSSYLDELLGPDGYFAIDPGQDTPYEWRVAFREALSDAGHALAPSVRHFIKTRYSTELCADSILALYSQVKRQ